MSVDVAIRLGLQGGKEVEKTFTQIGKNGSSELKQLRTAANDLSPALVLTSRSVGILKDKTEDLVAQTGNLGKLAGSFGNVGIAVAVGATAIAAAAGFAFSKAREAAEYADNLDDTATKVGTSTTALQELQYAMVAAGGTAEDAATGIEGLNTAIGLARSGLSAKALKPFAALGITKEDLQDVKSADELLPLLADKIAALGSVAEQNAVADKLKIAPLIPLLRQGGDAFRQLAQEAHDTGAVLDKDLVKTGADANQKFELLARTMKSQLAVAFVGLSPILVEFATRIAETATALNKLFNGPNFEDKQAATRAQIGHLQEQFVDLTERAKQVRAGMKSAYLEGGADLISASSAGGREAFAKTLDQQAAAARARASELIRFQRLAIEFDKSKAVVEPPSAGTSLIAPEDKAAKDKSAADEKARLAAIAAATKAYSSLIIQSMGEEEKAAYELKLRLQELDAEGAKAGFSRERIEADKQLAIVHAAAAKVIRENKLDDKDVDQFKQWGEEASAAFDKATAAVERYRNESLSPEQTRDRDLAALSAARDAAKGLKGDFTDSEYELALKKISDRYAELKQSIAAATVQGQLMNAVLTGQIKTWDDLGQVAIKILSDIIQKAATMTMYGGGPQSGGGFLSNLLSVGKAALGSYLGGSAGLGGTSLGNAGVGFVNSGVNYSLGETLPSLTGRATGGPIYAGDTRMTGERGRERISATSDGYITDAATTAAAMRAQRPAPVGGMGGDGSGEISVTLNNSSSTPLSAKATRTTDDQGRSGVKIDLVEAVDGRIEDRFGQMFDGKRDDARMAGSFGVRRRLSGG